MTGQDLAQRSTSTIAQQDELSIEQLTEQVKKIQDAMKAVMKNDEHYGVIPGTNKPTLLKPGAEKLCLLFRLAPTYRREITWHDDGHMTVVATCSLRHISTENLIAEGDGMCSTKEKKYAWRTAERLCPNCNQPYILKSNRPGEGWFCWKNPARGKHGCGAKFPANDDRIVKQDQGKVENPDIADTYNTVLKMACKRALVAAVLNGTAASDIFTQDVEDTELPAPPKQGSPNGQPTDSASVGMAESGTGSVGAQTTTGEAADRSAGPAVEVRGTPEGKGAPVAGDEPEQAALSEDEERDAKDRLTNLIETALEGHVVKLSEVIKSSMGYCGRAQVSPPTTAGTIKNLPFSVLQGIVAELKLEERLVGA